MCTAGKRGDRPNPLHLSNSPNISTRAQRITISSPTFRALDCTTLCVGYDGPLPDTSSHSPHPTFPTELRFDSDENARISPASQHFPRAHSSARRSPKQIHKQKQKQKLTRRASMSMFAVILKRLSLRPRNSKGIAHSSGRGRGLFRRVPIMTGGRDDREMGSLRRAGTNGDVDSGRKWERIQSMDYQPLMGSLDIDHEMGAPDAVEDEDVEVGNPSAPTTPRTADSTTSSFSERIRLQQRAKLMSRMKSVQVLGAEACRAVWEQR